MLRGRRTAIRRAITAALLFLTILILVNNYAPWAEDTGPPVPHPVAPERHIYVPAQIPPPSNASDSTSVQVYARALEKELQECQRARSPPFVLITTVTSAQMHELRELVGSLHRTREHNADVHLIAVYGFGLTERESREIRLWRNVDYHDAADALLAGQTLHAVSASTEPPKMNRLTLLTLLDLALRKYEMVIYVKIGRMFSDDALHTVANRIVKFGVALYADTAPQSIEDLALAGLRTGNASSILVNLPLQCARGYQCKPSLAFKLDSANRQLFASALPVAESSLVPVRENRVSVCFLLLRDDIIYSFMLQQRTQKDRYRRTDGLSVIALGAPTLSARESSWTDIAPLRLFLPSFLKSVTASEWQRFRYVIYFGYDEGDRFLDDADTMQQIQATVQSTIDAHFKDISIDQDDPLVRVEFVRFPFTKGWVTYLWNGLFATAMNDGANYFYQINDDVEFKTAGWSSTYVDTLGKNGDYGVTGPYDPFLKGRIFTQSFVGRKHYKIFGHLYPLDIKDWFSDDWMSTIYGPENTYKTDVVVRNVNDAKSVTRYVPCHTGEVYALIKDETKEILRDWLEDEHSSSTSDAFERHVSNGQILH